ncbi:hypothetical protein ACFFX1_30530 [Dactylosporangium sucinum]|uniref:Uncharacterized protein n=1 Tax=Dactylosporangium sucinum TaxID=1424081 RepID=A0A917U7I9_9ACTN|nr:hypothetical protein [Dactylosporangium sucinum]GGM63830.1 hypothetical protein GCM10007977_076720 [Dactylosporangium sucinum]
MNLVTEAVQFDLAARREDVYAATKSGSSLPDGRTGGATAELYAALAADAKAAPRATQNSVVGGDADA